MAQILDGKMVSERILGELKEKVGQMSDTYGMVPGLAVVIVGENPASKVYVRNKKKTCAKIGIRSEEYALPEETAQAELLALIDELNRKKDIHGILVQMPLPSHINEQAVIDAIIPAKDVDAFHPANVGRIMIGNYDILPCTPAGVMELIAESGLSVAGKECVVVGRSNIVGKPQAMLLLQQNGTVTIAHSKTKDLAEVTRRADILVVAVGRAKMITADMVKPGAVVIDVGMNRLPEKKLVGDVDFEGVKEVASFITPVPGGVGPMTIAMLMKNTVNAAYKQISLDK